MPDNEMSAEEERAKAIVDGFEHTDSICLLETDITEALAAAQERGRREAYEDALKICEQRFTIGQFDGILLSADQIAETIRTRLTQKALE